MAEVQLEKAFLYNLEEGKGDEAIPFMYNPEKLSINKTIPWKKQPKSKQELPKLQYTGGQGRQLKVDLDFDGTGGRADDDDGDVSKLFDKIHELTTVAAGHDDKNNPPMVFFAWGMGAACDFQGYIKTCNVTYTRFKPDGTPVRAKVSLQLVEAPDEAKLASTIPMPELETAREERLEAGSRAEMAGYPGD